MDYISEGEDDDGVEAAAAELASKASKVRARASKLPPSDDTATLYVTLLTSCVMILIVLREDTPKTSQARRALQAMALETHDERVNDSEEDAPQPGKTSTRKSKLAEYAGSDDGTLE